VQNTSDRDIGKESMLSFQRRSPLSDRRQVTMYDTQFLSLNGSSFTSLRWAEKWSAYMLRHGANGICIRNNILKKYVFCETSDKQSAGQVQSCSAEHKHLQKLRKKVSRVIMFRHISCILYLFVKLIDSHRHLALRIQGKNLCTTDGDGNGKQVRN